MTRHKPRTPEAVTWAAERYANAVSAAQDERAQPHVCGNCRTPTGRSALRCKNEPA